MAIFSISLISFFQILGVTAAVTLKIAGDASVDTQFCPGGTAEFECQTTKGGLLWETSSAVHNHVFDNPTQPSRMLGIFLLSLDGISLQTNGIAVAVNSTAVVNNVQLSNNGITLKCSENADLSMFSETVMRVAGPPPAINVTSISSVYKGSINSTLLISWSQSNCAVQYVVTITNSSDDRVYLNITTSNTNTTVTLPTGVEFCVTLVAVDSIGRRGPNSMPTCYVSPITSSIMGVLTDVHQLSTMSVSRSSSSIEFEMITTPNSTHTPEMNQDRIAVIVVPITIGIIIIVIIIIIIIFGLYMYMKQKKKKGKPDTSTQEFTTLKAAQASSTDSTDGNYEMQKQSLTAKGVKADYHDIPVAKVKEDGKDNLYSTASYNGKQFNHQIQTTQPILINEMRKHVEGYHSDSDFKFHTEFEIKIQAADVTGTLTTIGFNEENKPRNRSMKSTAYDSNRVILEPIEGHKHDFVNASYVDGYSSRKKFIATQGPKETTVVDFWRLVWQERPQSIVMVVNLVENTYPMCERYWPSRKGMSPTFGPFQVSILNEVPFSDYIERELEVCIKGHPYSSRTVTQYHFTSWPNQGVPHKTTPLMMFYKKVMAKWKKEGPPILVHSGAGVGRTGVFIAIDIALEQAEDKGWVDIAGIINRLREQRMQMVKTVQQYIFLHDAILEHVMCGQTDVPSNKLPSEGNQSKCALM